MKKPIIQVVSLTIVLVIVFCSPLSCLAHSGGTDSNGGHYNHSTGEYHYHHGHSAHQHKEGKCPYDFDYFYVIALVLCVAVFILDYMVLNGKIIMFFLSLLFGVIMIPFHLIGLICRLVDWIKEKRNGR